MTAPTRGQRLRGALDAYNCGDASALVATFAPDIRYDVVDLGRSFVGRTDVERLAASGAGRTTFSTLEVIERGSLLAYTYWHDSRAAGLEHQGPGLAVQRYDGQGRLQRHWAFRG